jgi:hypothetical protein
MKKMNKFVIGYAIVMFVITTFTTISLINTWEYICFDLVNIIVIGGMLAMGYIVSIALFIIEYKSIKK